MTKFMTRLMKDESGATAVEYGLIVALISIAIVAGAVALGTSLNTLFGDISTCMNNPTTTNCTIGGP
jgi:pilus assembly protein Flp/PilA